MVQRNDVSVTTDDGQCPAIVFEPDSDGPRPAVVVFMDGGGVRPAVISIAEHLAELGYVAFLPEMYYRHGPYKPFDTKTAFTDPDERGRLMSMVGSVNHETAGRDTAAFIEFLSGMSPVAQGKIGTTGYCLGGGLSLNAAARYPTHIAAAASFHGGHLAGGASDSPHRIAGQIAGRVYVAAAENDASFPPEQAARLTEAFTAGGVEFAIETYSAGHGFAVPDNPTYDATADARHWAALTQLYGTTLST